MGPSSGLDLLDLDLAGRDGPPHLGQREISDDEVGGAQSVGPHDRGVEGSEVEGRDRLVVPPRFGDDHGGADVARWRLDEDSIENHVAGILDLPNQLGVDLDLLASGGEGRHRGSGDLGHFHEVDDRAHLVDEQAGKVAVLGAVLGHQRPASGVARTVVLEHLRIRQIDLRVGVEELFRDRPKRVRFEADRDVVLDGHEEIERDPPRHVVSLELVLPHRRRLEHGGP